MRVLFEMSDSKGVYYHRQLTPHNEMCMGVPEVKVDQTKNILGMADKALQVYDVIVGHGRMSDDHIRVIKGRLKKPFVYDVDDIWYCQPDNTLHSYWKYSNHAENIVRNIKAADAVTTTSDILAHYIFKHTGVKAHIFPNAIAESDPQFIPIESKSERLRFAFIGGSTHVMDMPILRKAIARLWSQYPEYRDKWQIVYGGFDRENEVQMNVATREQSQIPEKMSACVNIEKNLTNNYQTVTPEYELLLRKYDKSQLPNNENYYRIHSADCFNYGRGYNHGDVGLCPLIDNTFNRCKSNLKVVEWGWMGKEVIASALATFYDRRTEQDIIFCSTTDEWVGAMVSHIENFIEHGTPIKSNLQSVVREHYNAKNFIQKRYELYKSLL